MWQLQEALATAAAAVLVNASGAAQSLKRALPPVGESGIAATAASAGSSGAHAPHPQDLAASWAVQLAVATVLCNTQRYACALRAACNGGVVVARSRLQLCPRPAEVAACLPVPSAAPPLLHGRGQVAQMPGQEVEVAREGTADTCTVQEEAHSGSQEWGGARRTSGGRLGERTANKWTREQTEVMVKHVKGLPPTRCLALPEAMQKLGLDRRLDPDKRLRASVASKLQTLRNMLDHGLDPLAGGKVHRVKPNTYNWRAWLRQAFMAFPNRTGTLEDAAAFMEAHPSIAPLLDRRPDPRVRDWPRWRRNMTSTRRKCPELEDTGLKQGRHFVLRYNEQLADALAARRVKAPKRGVNGLPHLGKAQ